ncbi:hypothetical protein PghCCS26_61990 [Paenibacillus glycanilyticus]|uniref:DUF3221 domain-containing protein n=1 Tax=Paenibacillus glycanilyticus TaxID=126569 RepID=A0ABQ6NX07_9BACL|nr:DUF3221 domain-containing protein [Paenibacillus glycanilyticus]GMK49069.1 hypothetical protein PghCCS26_61990 [Paenibacillus glycanilyticus]
MKKGLLILFFLLTVMVFVGCSSSSNSDDSWDYNEGFVVSKEDGRILVVREKPSDFKDPLSDILQNAKPNAMWISVEQVDYDAFAVGDHVSIKIPNGGIINRSYPAQTTADVGLLR